MKNYSVFVKLSVFISFLGPVKAFSEDFLKDYKVSIKARESIVRSIKNGKTSSGDKKAITDAYNYFLSRPSLMGKLKPSTSKEILYFQTLNEEEKSEYLEKAITNRAAMVAAGAVAAAIAVREVMALERQISAAAERGGRLGPDFLQCPEDAYFDPKTEIKKEEIKFSPSNF